MMFGRGFGFNGLNCLGQGFGFGGLGMIVGMIIFAAIVTFAVLAIIHFTRKPARRNTGSDALEVLKMRLAKGEITEEEYVKLRNVLLNSEI
jgi:putative membrane protein